MNRTFTADQVGLIAVFVVTKFFIVVGARIDRMDRGIVRLQANLRQEAVKSMDGVLFAQALKRN